MSDSRFGGHIDRCDTCGNSISYNSCRNRHCPKCQGKTEKIGYKLDKANFTSTLFSCGFTLPDSINVLAMLLDWFMICFLSRLGNFEKFWKSQRNQTGMIAVLHTWGQNLSLHPLHCIVPGGGVDKMAIGRI
jgi:hypothetical protein